ncbi:MAG TPA: hypothetical protein VIN11_02220 [Roseivirga sp.]
MKEKTLRRNWLLFGASGLAIVGLGLSLMGEAFIRKYEATTFHDWFWLGTLALVVINSGLALFGKAIITRVKLDLMYKQ